MKRRTYFTFKEERMYFEKAGDLLYIKSSKGTTLGYLRIDDEFLSKNAHWYVCNKQE